MSEHCKGSLFHYSSSQHLKGKVIHQEAPTLAAKTGGLQAGMPWREREEGIHPGEKKPKRSAPWQV